MSSLEGETTLAPRLIGHLGEAPQAPLLLVVAGLHGNEPAGVGAARRVVSRLAAEGTRLRGELVAIAGNRRALARGERYLARDLNRGWTAERVRALRAGSAASPEDLEQRELLSLLDGLLSLHDRPRFCLDLHTTSSE